MLKRVVLIILLVLVSTPSFAVPITGQLDFVGAATVDRNPDGTAYISIDFLGSPIAIISTGTFSSFVSTGDVVTVTDPWNVTAPQLSMWSAGGFVFDLATVTVNDGTTVGGFGAISGNGFYSTSGFWSFTSQGNTDGTFSFSSTTVPAPGIVLLLGLGLAGIGFSRKFHKD